MTDQGALPEIVGDIGIVVDATVAGLRGGLLALAEHPDDAMRAAARHRWETSFSPERRGTALVEIYRSLTDRPRPAPAR